VTDIYPDTKFKVLIVEDEILVAMEMQIILRLAGHEVVGIAQDLESAMQLAAQFTPHLALVDINLSKGESGFDVATAFSEIGLPLLFASGNCPPTAAADVVLGCLNKPFDDVSLTLAVETAQTLIYDGPLLQPPNGLNLFRR
jgi:DNA-binding NarL/FixJ family response regulator